MRGPAMHVEVMNERGYEEALYGLGKSHGLTTKMPYEEFITGATNEARTAFSRLVCISQRLAPKDGGHNKFLESIQTWVLIEAPRYWWQEYDTYRVGMTKQSESTMHTLVKKPIDINSFEDGEKLPQAMIDHLEDLRMQCTDPNAGTRLPLWKLKAALPEGFIQGRVINTNYKTWKHILYQRHDHRLPHWQIMFAKLSEQFKLWNMIDRLKDVKAA